MKAIGVVLLTESVNTLSLYHYRDSGKAHYTVELYRKSYIQSIFSLYAPTKVNTLRTQNMVITKVISLFYDE